MGKNLVIVESPAKAKTIENYLGNDFEVKSSYGHVRDLPKGNNAIDIENDFKPTYEISADKKQVVSELKKLAKSAETVWLATDDDREGEAISWHLLEALGLKESKIKRIVFREITKTAIQKAIQNPRTIDIDLVNAQQARRVLDRLVGFELSPVLWRKIKTGLSAGRVQSVAVRFIVEREREIEHFKPESAFKVVAIFELENGKTLEANLAQRFEQQEAAHHFLTQCIGAIFSIKNLEKKPRKKSPAPPFTTSTLQQQASAKLRYPVAKTMLLAQRLYEAGHITYMRTDSLNLSEEAITNAAHEIKSNYGDKYLKIRRYKTKKQDAQEAHEAIRPTNFASPKAGNTAEERRLYELIWKRAIASQMADAEIEKTIATIDISTLPDAKLTATGEVITFDGFLKVYLEVGIEEHTHQEEEEDADTKGMLPPLEIGQVLDLNQMTATERFTRPSPRYTEASLVKKLEEMGIGRPSTYAPTISTVQKRGYVIKESRDGKQRNFRQLTLQNHEISALTDQETYGSEKNKLFPTDTAMVVNDFLVEHFPNVVDYSFTANVEEKFDEIAHGRVRWEKMIKEFYNPFHKKVEEATEIDRSEINTGKVLGTDPKTGLQVSVRLGRYGPLAQLGERIEDDDSEENKPKYASLQRGQLMETITLQEALELFKLPRQVGTFEGKVMTAAIGRFGPYIRHDSKFVSLGNELDPHTVDEQTAIQLIQAKREADAKKLIKIFPENEEVKILNGRWGPYIAVGKQNVKLPKELKEDLEKLKAMTLEDCLKMAEEQEKNGKPKAQKTTTKKATAPKKTATKTTAETKAKKKTVTKKSTAKTK